MIVCGDMNTEPTDLCYRVIKHLPGLIDTWDMAGQEVSVFIQCTICQSDKGNYHSEIKRENRPTQKPIIFSYKQFIF